MKQLDAFTRAYAEAALWSSTDNADDSGGEPLDANYGIEDIAEETLAQMIEDCEAFQRDNAADIALGHGGQGESGESFTATERAGHDFWLTRNHHGAGFWDGDWPEDVGKRLTDASHAYGSVDLIVGDDGKVY